MTDCSLLFPQKREFVNRLDERVTSDLSVDTVASALKTDAEVLKKYLLDFSATEEELSFRHEVAEDFIRNPDLFNELMQRKAEFETIKEKTDSASKEIHSTLRLREPTTDGGGVYTIVFIFHQVSEALNAYWSFFDGLISALDSKDLKSAGMENLKSFLHDIVSGSDIEAIRAEISDYPYLSTPATAYSGVLRLNRSLHIDSISYKKVGHVRRDLRAKKKSGITVKPSGRALNRTLFTHNKAFAVKLLEIAQSYRRILENIYEDLMFYELYFALTSFYETNGLPLTKVESFSDADEIGFDGLFDISLAADAVVKGINVLKNVKPNSAKLTKQKIFISGMNQGGKTVFIRSVGLAILLAKTGLPVSAERFSCPDLNCLYTFFPIDDIVYEANSRFRNELAMMKKIVEKAPKNSLVLMNEPFISTTEKEATSLIENLLVFFGKRDNLVMTVTHFKKLLSSIDGSAQSFVAAGAPSFSVSETEPYLLTGRDLLPFLE